MLGRPGVAAAIACALALMGSSAVDSAVWSVPVQRRVVTLSEPPAYLYADPVRSLKTKSDTHANVWTPSFPEAQTRATQDTVFERVRGDYVAEFMFGTPPQPISISLDLGWSGAHVLNHKLDTHQYYDHDRSSTYRENGTQIVFDDHTDYVMRGFVSQDSIMIPATASSDVGLHVSSVSFVELSGPDSSLKLLQPTDDGFIGLGPHPDYDTGLPSFMRTMIAQRLLDQAIVGVLLSEWDAHVTFGGVNTAYTDGDITYFTETRDEKFGWWLPVSGIRVNNQLITGSSRRAVIDEGLRISGPRHQVEMLERAVGVRTDGTLPCEGSGPNITMTLGSFELTLTYFEYVIVRGGACYFAFYPALPPLDHWLLGRHFMERVYMVLEYGETYNDARFGLAHLKRV